ncbi:MAG: exonuclease domain-containing protein [Tepidisphaeraceae bacterium]
MGLSLLDRLLDLPVAVVDVETTGASADLGERVVEIGVVRYERGAKVSEYQQLIDPKRRIAPGVSALTGITQNMLDGRPTFDEQLPAMVQAMSGAVIVGHNVGFDLSFLAREFARCGQGIESALNRAPVLDTVRMARRRFGRGGNGLQQLAARLGIEADGAHRALADARTTGALLELLLEPIGGWSVSLVDAIASQGGPISLTPTPGRSQLPLELEEALEQRMTVTMEYLDARANRTQRVIEPLHVRRRNGELILVAHCRLRDGPRTFKLERIVRVAKVP